jgi:hypothetical protein
MHFSVSYQQNHPREDEGHPGGRWNILPAAHLPMPEGTAIVIDLNTDKE